MPVSDKYIKEVVEYSIIFGREQALETFKLSEETFNRYKRLYRQKFGDAADLMSRVREKFDDEQLNHLLTLGTVEAKHNTVHYDLSGTEVRFLAISDTHFGSTYSDPARTLAAFEEAKRQECQFAIHAGDISEGQMNRADSMFEVSHIGFKEQRKHSIDILRQWGRKLYLINGNHDASFNTKLGAGCNMAEDICERIPESYFVGDGLGSFMIDPYNIHMSLFHGNDAGSSYALSYRLQRIINNMNPSQKPHILISGHDHKQFYMHYRNIHAVAGGCMQKQTPWMAQKGLIAMEGFWIIKMGVAQSEVKWFEPRFYPFYN